jgi:hypothetical protein
MPLAWHLIQRLDDDRVIVRDIAQRRIYAETAARLGRDCGLFVFGLPDNHGHAGLDCDRATAGRFAQRLAVSLRIQLDLPVSFSPLRLVPIQDQAHLRNTLDYILGQATHHRVQGDPLLEATSLPDLLGLRTTGAYLAGRVRALLPRTHRELLLEHYGLTELRDDLDEVDFGDLAVAAASAVGAPRLDGRSLPVVEARAAAAHVARSRLSVSRIAGLLGVTPRAVRKLLLREPDERIARAIRLQLDLRQRLREPMRVVPDTWRRGSAESPGNGTKLRG